MLNDRAEIGTFECRLSSNLYGCALNRTKGLSPVCTALNLLISDRDDYKDVGGRHCRELNVEEVGLLSRSMAKHTHYSRKGRI